MWVLSSLQQTLLEVFNPQLAAYNEAEAGNSVENDLENQYVPPSVVIDNPLQNPVAVTEEAKIPDEIIDIDGISFEFKCPITRAIMQDPVIAADDITYERQAITDWFKKSSVSPKTNVPLKDKYLIPNDSLQTKIREFNDQRCQKITLDDLLSIPDSQHKTTPWYQEQLRLWKSAKKAALKLVSEGQTPEQREAISDALNQSGEQEITAKNARLLLAQGAAAERIVLSNALKNRNEELVKLLFFRYAWEPTIADYLTAVNASNNPDFLCWIFSCFATISSAHGENIQNISAQIADVRLMALVLEKTENITKTSTIDTAIEHKNFTILPLLFANYLNDNEEQKQVEEEVLWNKWLKAIVQAEDHTIYARVLSYKPVNIALSPTLCNIFIEAFHMTALNSFLLSNPQDIPDDISLKLVYSFIAKNQKLSQDIKLLRNKQEAYNEVKQCCLFCFVPVVFLGSLSMITVAILNLTDTVNEPIKRHSDDQHDDEKRQKDENNGDGMVLTIIGGCFLLMSVVYLYPLITENNQVRKRNAPSEEAISRLEKEKNVLPDQLTQILTTLKAHDKIIGERDLQIINIAKKYSDTIRNICRTLYPDTYPKPREVHIEANQSQQAAWWCCWHTPKSSNAESAPMVYVVKN